MEAEVGKLNLEATLVWVRSHPYIFQSLVVLFSSYSCLSAATHSVSQTLGQHNPFAQRSKSLPH